MKKSILFFFLIGIFVKLSASNEQNLLTNAANLDQLKQMLVMNQEWVSYPEYSGAEWSHYARTSFGPCNYSITSEDYRFIQYKDGSEEFYNHKIDPQEWHNDIDNSKYSEVIEKHRAEIPNGQY